MTYLALANGAEDILKLCMKDRLHQPYRKKLIAHYDVITKKAREMGCLNTCISGAGPTILAINSVANRGFEADMEAYLREKVPGWQIIPLAPDHTGVQILGG